MTSEIATSLIETQKDNSDVSGSELSFVIESSLDITVIGALALEMKNSLFSSFDASQQLFFAFFAANGFDDSDPKRQFLIASALAQIGFGLTTFAIF